MHACSKLIAFTSVAMAYFNYASVGEAGPGDMAYSSWFTRMCLSVFMQLIFLRDRYKLGTGKHNARTT